MNPNMILEIIRTPHKLNRLLLKPRYVKDDFDSNSVDVPFPFSYRGDYYMFYNGFDGIGYRTGLAVSDDLINWTKRGPLLERGEPGSPSEFNASITSLLRNPDLHGGNKLEEQDGQLLGTWHGYPEPGQEQGKGYIGICRGTDLYRWTLEAPCLTVEGGASWEQGGLYKPNMIRHNGRYYIFYNAKETEFWPWHEQIGVAWSDNLITWTRHDLNPIVPVGGSGFPDEIFTADPFIMKSGGTWIMFYYGLAADGHARGLAAWSKDLLTWTKYDEVLVDVGPEGSIDDQYAHKSGVIAKDGVLYHYYGASRKKTPTDMDEVNAKDRRGIAVATSVPV